MRALYETGFSNIPTSFSKNDGLILNDVYITSIVKCAPPQNKPTVSEISNCNQYLIKELDALGDLSVIITLGKIAFDTYCKIINQHRLKFSHKKIHRINNEKTLIVSYHPSKRNTNTRILKWSEWIEIFRIAKKLINDNAKIRDNKNNQ